MPVNFLTLLFGALGSSASAKTFARIRLAIMILLCPRLRGGSDYRKPEPAIDGGAIEPAF